jgi:YbbR domain-containing protein
MRILLRNWHLKLGAVGLATVLYTGLVFSGSFTEETQSGVPVEGINQGQTVLLGTGLGTVDVVYRAAPEAADGIDTSSFAASVDLSTYDLERAAEPQSLEVDVRSLVPGITVEEWSPRQVTVTLDEIATKQIPVVVETGELPEGLEAGRPSVSDDEVTARGASSLIARVDHALARVRVDPSGIDVIGPVTLVALGVDGEIVEPIELTPDTVSVDVDVREVETNKTVPVRPIVEGTPAPGFALQSLGVDPAVVTLRGLPEALSGIEEVSTEPLSIDGVSVDQVFTAALAIPEGARLVAGGDATVTVTASILPSISSRTFVTGVVCEGSGENACLPGLDQVAVTLSGPGALLAQLSAAEVTPTLDVTGFAPGGYQVTVTVGALPDGVTVEAISPESVPVTIEAPATPSPSPAA